MDNWNKEFHNVSVKCQEKLVQIKTDKALMTFLADPKTKGALLLSDYVHKLYEKEIGRPLKITRDSLAIEILGHVYLDVFANLAKTTKLEVLQPLANRVKQSTDIIDCGEKDIDPNRVVWDTLEEKGLKSVIYTMCGDMA